MTQKLQTILQDLFSRRMLVIAASSLALSVALPANAQDVRTLDQGGVIHSIKVLADSYTEKSGDVAEDQARILFYRPVGASQDNAATVYVNDMYHASLVAGGYSPICLKPGTTDVEVREMKHSRGAKDGYDSVTVVNTQPGKTTYVRVNETTNSRWQLQAVPEQQAEQELNGTKRQVHTISRVIGAEACKPSDKARIQLAGDTLFKFNRSDRAGLTGKGTAALDSIIAQLNQQYKSLSSLVVIGYADPLGNPAKNKILSDNRAKTVLNYLNEHGLKGTTQVAEGKGSADPVIATCGKTVTPQSIACNQPNRRVVIDVSGQRN